MTERIVGVEIGREKQIIYLQVELSKDWVHLRALPKTDAELAHRFLYHLHLQYLHLNVPHRWDAAKDDKELEYIDSISVPSGSTAETWLFPKLLGLWHGMDDRIH